MQYLFYSAGSELYGVEPPSYYFLNSILNQNIVFILFLMFPLVCETWSPYMINSLFVNVLYLTGFDLLFLSVFRDLVDLDGPFSF